MKTLRSIPALAAIALMALSPAAFAAENLELDAPPAAFLDGSFEFNLEKVAWLYEEQGIHIHEQAEGRLHEGALATATVYIRAGESVIIRGQGDARVQDLDLSVFDPAGRPVKADTDYDATPCVEFTARRSGYYSIEVEMVSCSGHAADFAVIVAERF